MHPWAVVVLLVRSEAFFSGPPTLTRGRRQNQRTTTHPLLLSSQTGSLENLAHDVSTALESCVKEVTRTCKVKVAPVANNRLGLIATEPISKGDVVLGIPYDDKFQFEASSNVFKGILPNSFDSWTGDMGLIALQILNELARTNGAGLQDVQRPPKVQQLINAWLFSLPSPSEMDHPLLWPENGQEVLQFSSTSKIYRLLDDLEEDANWLIENVFDKDRARFPETATWNGEQIPCFSVEGFKWALALAKSRAFFLDGNLRLVPLLDMCNHADDAEEIRSSSMGAFGATKGAQLIAATNYKVGDEVVCSYGPKSAADYLLEHGFCPPECWKTAVSELSFEIDSEDRFYDDKLDILEYETYDQAPMDPVQSFDIVSAPGRDGKPDPAMIQFLRLCKLSATDAFLLESVFRKEVWDFMADPVSEANELEVVTAITEACQKALDELEKCPPGGPPVCAELRASESKALTRTIEYLQREKVALDLKEYYQERRLKALGLDSVWTPEDDVDAELGFGQTRVPGGADYDW